ncbi:GNAT family N-acetyltransferase [Sporosarcina sp. FSL K6-1522]|uniref:GNAT family N-acetyltransferase n=1 Tax=Sporosarcina sp. FSL K6-1522 TaxID=2921554 RepID=UPI00315AC324
MLTNEQLHAIAALQKECQQADDLHLKLNWDMLRQRDDHSMDFFYEENGELIAYLALYGFGTSVEVCGMVKPSARRRQHFSTLWQTARQTIEEKGFSKILLNAPAPSTSAKAWLTAQSCTYDFSEFQLKWHQQPIEASNDVLLRKSRLEDTDFAVQLDMLAFNMSEADARLHQEEIQDGPNEQHFIIVAEGQDIGKIRVSNTDGEAYIYGFAILPEYQGKGYGGKTLCNIVKQEHEAGRSILLDVETKNMHALGLYEKIGFKIVQGQDYYLWHSV